MKNAAIINCILVIFLLSCKETDVSSGTEIAFSILTNYNPPYSAIDSNIVVYNEILGYDPTKHIFLLSDEAGKRIRNKNYPTSGSPFAIAVDNEIIYIATFMPGYSSSSCFQCITVEPYSYDNKYRVELGYPSSQYFTGPDLRNDERIISVLKRDKKLIDISK